ncbi:MAG: monovalent cation/H(+) antiporter subunit G [Zoogloeaceae bacterium]|nr:monovalent cation/H(+) antiporter subunit G [Rhodocyclaceae bacterium]MCP5255067.1 monovalent cation/H(+) antiporter subunit G [Zoogloeaceae bacterium]
MSETIGGLLILAGTLLLAIACLGVLRLPDALSRQHAATKAATLALGIMALGVAVLQGGAAWWWRSALLMVTLFLTLPLAAHALARVAARKRSRPSTKRGA